MFSKRDLENVIAICEQDEDAPAQAGRLKERCERALAYRDCEIHITEEDKRFLSQYYDEDMDPEAKETLDKVLGGGKSDVLGKRVWISKLALSKGVYEMEVVRVSEDGKTVYGHVWNEAYRGEGREWHRTKEEAMKRAKVLKEKKIASLRKQIDKISALDFGNFGNVPDKTNEERIKEMSTEELAEYLCAEGWKMSDYQECLAWLRHNQEQGKGDLI